MLSHSGHGVNSYAIHYYLVQRPLRMFLQLGWGGVYDDAKEDAAKIQIQTIASGLDLFLLDIGRYPTDQEGLKALVDAPPNLPNWAGPYVSQASILNDPWGRPYVYHVPSRNPGIAYDLYTLGPDGDATGPPTATANQGG